MHLQFALRLAIACIVAVICASNTASRTLSVNENSLPSTSQDPNERLVRRAYWECGPGQVCPRCSDGPQLAPPHSPPPHSPPSQSPPPRLPPLYFPERQRVPLPKLVVPPLPSNYGPIVHQFPPQAPEPGSPPPQPPVEVNIAGSETAAPVVPLAPPGRRSQKRQRTGFLIPPSRVDECASCGVRESPGWRRGSNQEADLCNACGIRYHRNKGKLRPIDGKPGLELQPESVVPVDSPQASGERPQKRRRIWPLKPPSAPDVDRCANCGVLEAAKWGKITSDVADHCDACVHYQRRRNKPRRIDLLRASSRRVQSQSLPPSGAGTSDTSPQSQPIVGPSQISAPPHGSFGLGSPINSDSNIQGSQVSQTIGEQHRSKRLVKRACEKCGAPCFACELNLPPLPIAPPQLPPAPDSHQVQPHAPAPASHPAPKSQAPAVPGTAGPQPAAASKSPPRMKLKPPPQRSGVTSCANCRAVESVRWRKGPGGIPNLCNSCGIKYADPQRNDPRPPTTPGVEKCANCGIRQSRAWRRGPSGLADLCNACGYHQKTYGVPRPLDKLKPLQSGTEVEAAPSQVSPVSVSGPSNAPPPIAGPSHTPTSSSNGSSVSGPATSTGSDNWGPGAPWMQFPGFGVPSTSTYPFQPVLQSHPQLPVLQPPTHQEINAPHYAPTRNMHTQVPAGDPSSHTIPQAPPGNSQPMADPQFDLSFFYDPYR